VREGWTEEQQRDKRELWYVHVVLPDRPTDLLPLPVRTGDPDFPFLPSPSSFFRPLFPSSAFSAAQRVPNNLRSAPHQLAAFPPYIQLCALFSNSLEPVNEANTINGRDPNLR
jgi:hypothetical protein